MARVGEQVVLELVRAAQARVCVLQARAQALHPRVARARGLEAQALLVEPPRGHAPHEADERQEVERVRPPRAVPRRPDADDEAADAALAAHVVAGADLEAVRPFAQAEVRHGALGPPRAPRLVLGPEHPRRELEAARPVVEGRSVLEAEPEPRTVVQHQVGAAVGLAKGAAKVDIALPVGHAAHEGRVRALAERDRRVVAEHAICRRDPRRARGVAEKVGRQQTGHFETDAGRAERAVRVRPQVVADHEHAVRAAEAGELGVADEPDARAGPLHVVDAVARREQQPATDKTQRTGRGAQALRCAVRLDAGRGGAGVGNAVEAAAGLRDPQRAVRVLLPEPDLAVDAADAPGLGPPAVAEREAHEAVFGRDEDEVVAVAQRDERKGVVVAGPDELVATAVEHVHAVVGGDEEPCGRGQQLPHLHLRHARDGLETGVGRPHAGPAEAPRDLLEEALVGPDVDGPVVLGRRVDDADDAAADAALVRAEPRVAREQVDADEAVLERGPQAALAVGVEPDHVVARRQAHVLAVDPDEAPRRRDDRDAAAERPDGVEHALPAVPVRHGDGRVRAVGDEVLGRGALDGARRAGRLDRDEPFAADDSDESVTVGQECVHLSVGKGRAAGDQTEPARAEALDADAVFPHVDGASDEKGRPEARLGAPHLHAPPVPPEQPARALKHDAVRRRVRRPHVLKVAVLGQDVADEAVVGERARRVARQKPELADPAGVEPARPADRERVDEQTRGCRGDVETPVCPVVLEDALRVGDVDRPGAGLRECPVLRVGPVLLPRRAPRNKGAALGDGGRPGLSRSAGRGEEQEEREGAQHEAAGRDAAEGGPAGVSHRRDST